MAATQTQPLKVLLSIHPQLDALDFVGPLEILSHAHLPSPAEDPTRPSHRSQPIIAFQCTITATEALTTSTQGVKFARDIDAAEAHRRLAEFDVLVIPGGGSLGVLEQGLEPLHLIHDFAMLPKREGGRERVLLSVCTGSLFLASQSVLRGLVACTHPDYTAKLDVMCNSQGDGPQSTKVVDERYVVNRVDEKGLRVITSGGISCGMDATLWLIENVAGQAARENVERQTQYTWRKSIFVTE